MPKYFAYQLCSSDYTTLCNSCNYKITIVFYIFTSMYKLVTIFTAIMLMNLLDGSILLAVNKILLVSICQHRQT